MTPDLESVRRAVPQCTGLAWLAGDPLAVVLASGAPIGDAWPSWNAIAKAAPALLRDGPLASPEVLLRTAGAMVLLTERPSGVVVVIVATTSSSGLALVQARMAATQVAQAVGA